MTSMSQEGYAATQLLARSRRLRQAGITQVIVIAELAVPSLHAVLFQLPARAEVFLAWTNLTGADYWVHDGGFVVYDPDGNLVYEPDIAPNEAPPITGLEDFPDRATALRAWRDLVDEHLPRDGA